MVDRVTPYGWSRFCVSRKFTDVISDGDHEQHETSNLLCIEE